MSRALFIVDVQNDFTERGALGVVGGDEVAERISRYLGGTYGADYDEVFDTRRVTHHLKKGQGKPAYSLFEGVTDDGLTADEILDEHGIRDIDVVGIATDYCVRASALDALGSGRTVRVLTDLVAGVHPDSSAAALVEIEAAGARLTRSN